jgi:hypothetical protein
MAQVFRSSMNDAASTTNGITSGEKMRLSNDVPELAFVHVMNGT